MFLDDLKTARKVSLAILLVTIQLIVISAFGARWTSGSFEVIVTGHGFVVGTSPPYSTLIPYPSNADWWYGLTAVVMYLVLIICFLYVLWTIAQIALPDRIPLDLKMIVFVDVVFSAILTVMLLVAYCFFAGGFGGKTYLPTLASGFRLLLLVGHYLFSCLFCSCDYFWIELVPKQLDLIV
ncbi:hypothetical protein L3Y34_015467 [Caenorhabditis briggsae]|uniref:MARVEL domain-containing protein n=1 Tax=Caenorhabditis briggsae TaxID=6238 RepID=A0AAE9DW71_CAEBR|nr:hypothetical protein L3Y34_015467 [Caenorhabditis briggsae]